MVNQCTAAGGDATALSTLPSPKAAASNISSSAGITTEATTVNAEAQAQAQAHTHAHANDKKSDASNANKNKSYKHRGLSTNVALNRLNKEILSVLVDYERHYETESHYRKVRSAFVKRYDSPLGWLSIGTTLLTTVALFIAGMHMPAVCLFAILSLDLCVVVRENNLRRTEIFRKTRRVLSELQIAEQYLSEDWQPCNYPHLCSPMSPCVSLQWTYRDGVIVNLPWALLVRGDYIVLRPGHIAPGPCEEVDTKRYFNAHEIYGASHISDPPVKPVARAPLADLVCCLESTPYLETLHTCLKNSLKRPPTIYNQQRYLLVTKYIQQWGFISALLITLCAGVLRLHGYGLPTDEKHNWRFVMIESPAATVIPLLPLIFPIMWIAMNLWGIARLQCFLKTPQAILAKSSAKSFEEDLDTPIFNYENISLMRTNVVRTWTQLWQGDSEFLPRSANVVQVLGSITALCCIDKKGILSWPNPTAEKVFFLHNTEEQLNDDGRRSNSQMSMQSESDGMPDVNEDSKERGIVAEVLDLTHDQHCPFRLEFDDHEWKAHIKSLKPLGLAILLNTCSPLTHAHYAQFCGHVTAVAMLDKDLVPVTNRYAILESSMKSFLHGRCLCELAKQIGFTDHATDRFSLEGQLASYRHLQPDVVRRDIRFARQLQLSSKVKVPFPHSLSVVMRENPGGYLSLFTQGTADIILDCCDDFWDGKDLRPLSAQDRKRALDFYQRSALTAYCTAFAYRPLRHGIHGALSGSQHNEGPIAYLELPPESKLRMQHVDKLHCDFECSRHAKLSHSISTDSLLFSENKEEDINDVDSCFEMQCHQVFIGMVTMQYQAQTDIVQLVERLERACIRFVHFSKENELRSRVFSEKMGLESGWNCHISLLSDPTDEATKQTNHNAATTQSTTTTTGVAVKLLEEQQLNTGNVGIKSSSMPIAKSMSTTTNTTSTVSTTTTKTTNTNAISINNANTTTTTTTTTTVPLVNHDNHHHNHNDDDKNHSSTTSTITIRTSSNTTATTTLAMATTEANANACDNAKITYMFPHNDVDNDDDNDYDQDHDRNKNDNDNPHNIVNHVPLPQQVTSQINDDHDKSDDNDDDNNDEKEKQNHNHHPHQHADNSDLKYLLGLPTNLESTKNLSSSAPGAISNPDECKALNIPSSSDEAVSVDKDGASTHQQHHHHHHRSFVSHGGGDGCGSPSQLSLNNLNQADSGIKTAAQNEAAATPAANAAQSKEVRHSLDSAMDENCRSLSTLTESTEQSAPVHFDMSNRAKLPRGIENIRPHLEQVDNVPLQVSLFTDCSAEATRQMLDIMQSYGEIVVCLGSSASNSNSDIFLQADCSIAVEPLYPQVCQDVDAYTEVNIYNNKLRLVRAQQQRQQENLSTPTNKQTNTDTNQQHHHTTNNLKYDDDFIDDDPYISEELLESGLFSNSARPMQTPANTISPIYLSRLLNSLPCSISICREDPLSLVAIIELSRRFSSGLWNCIQYWACCAGSISVINLLCACLSLPPILTPLMVIYLMCIPVPLIALALAHIDIDPKIMNRATGKKQTEYDTRVFGFVVWCYGLKFITPVLTMIVSYCVFMAHPRIAHIINNNSHVQQLNNDDLLSSSTSSTLMPLLNNIEDNTGNGNIDNDAGNNEFLEILQIARTFSFLGILLHFVVVSASFVHRDHSLWQRNPFRNRIWTFSCLGLATVHLIICIATVLLDKEAYPLLGNVWPAVITLYCGTLLSLIVSELTKMHEIKVNTRYQRRARLDFGTKLGMNSPF